MRKPAGKGWFLMGQVGVDSGSLMIGDPCYLPGFVENEATGHVPLLDTFTNKLYQYVYNEKQLVHDADRIGNYDECIPETTITFNQGRASGRLVEIPHPEDRTYSRSGCHWATCDSKDGFAVLGDCNESLVFRSGYGDGVYNVWGWKNKEGRIIEVRIMMDD